MPAQPFEFLDHTGDLAVLLRGRDPADLLRSGSLALFHVITGGAPAVRPRRAWTVEATGADLEELLVGWMNRLLSLHHLEGLLFARFDVDPPARGRVRGAALGGPIGAGEREALREVKAVTYHDLAVRREGRLWTARVVLDV